MPFNKDQINLLLWYAKGREQTDISRWLGVLCDIINEGTDIPASEIQTAKIAGQWTKRKAGWLFLILKGKTIALGTIALSPEDGSTTRARFGFLLGHSFRAKGADAIALEKLLPFALKKGFTHLSGAKPCGEISFSETGEPPEVTVSFD